MSRTFCINKLFRAVLAAVAVGVMALGTASVALADEPGDSHGRPSPADGVTVAGPYTRSDYQATAVSTTAASGGQEASSPQEGVAQDRDDEIERLKQRIAELEAKLKALEERIATLESGQGQPQDAPCLPEGYEFLGELTPEQQQEFADALRENKRKRGNYQGICGTGIMSMTAQEYAAFLERERQFEQWLNSLGQGNATPGSGTPAQPQGPGGAVTSGDPHELCDKPQRFQCGQHYLWWLENHKHVEKYSDLTDEELRKRLADPNTPFEEWKSLLKEFRSREQSKTGADGFRGQNSTGPASGSTQAGAQEQSQDQPQSGQGPDIGNVVKTAAVGGTGCAMGEASKMIDRAIQTVGERAATEGWYDNATRSRLTRAGAASRTLSTASKAFSVAGVVGGLDRAASSDDPAEQTMGCLDAFWSTVPGPYGLAGSIGNAAGQEIGKIDTGVETAQGGSTVHDWLTAAAQEYIERGFLDTFIGGWKDILGIR